MQYLPLTEHRPLQAQWRAIALTAASVALFALVIAFGQPWGLPVALRAVLAAFAGVGLAAGQLMRGHRS